MAVILLSSIMHIIKIRNKGAKLGTMSPMDQVLWRTHLLEKASLIGFTLFLGFIIDRMHYYLQKLVGLRSIVVSLKREVERVEKENKDLKEKEEKSSNQMTQLQEQVSNLSETLKKLKVESAEKDKRIETAESHVASLHKQAADLLLEYDRLLEDNQNLQNQAPEDIVVCDYELR